MHGGLEWEVDVFEGENAGLVVAEVELESERQSIDLPDWVGLEVTHDPRYLNANLAKAPFTRWSLTASGDV
jgi:CYTH domain-containing protein